MRRQFWSTAYPMRPKSPFGAMDECGGPPSGRPSVHRRIPVGCYNKMPFELLRRLCAETMPVKLVKMVTEVLHSPDRSQLGGHEFDSRKDRH